VGHLREYIYAVLSRIIKDLMERFQAAVTTADVNMFGCVQENAVWYTAMCLEMVRHRFKQLL
jgi:hypothetical protein